MCINVLIVSSTDKLFIFSHFSPKPEGVEVVAAGIY